MREVLMRNGTVTIYKQHTSEYKEYTYLLACGKCLKITKRYTDASMRQLISKKVGKLRSIANAIADIKMNISAGYVVIQEPEPELKITGTYIVWEHGTGHLKHSKDWVQ